MKKSRVLVSLALCLLLLPSPSHAAVDEFAMQERVNVPNGQVKKTFNMGQVSLRTALDFLASEVGLSLILDTDPELDQTVPMEFTNTPLNQILEALLRPRGLSLFPYSGAWVVSKNNAHSKKVIRFVPLQFVSAAGMVQTLNALLGLKGDGSGTGASAGSSTPAAPAPAPTPQAAPSPGATQASKTTPAADVTPAGSSALPAPPVSAVVEDVSIKVDPRSNRLVLVGPEHRVKLAEALAKKLDVLTPSRVFRLSHVSPTDAIDLLRATYFESGRSGSGGSSSEGGPVTVNTQYMDFSKAYKDQQLTIQKLDIQRESPRFVPMPSENALFVMGSPAELDLVEQVLKTIDRRRPQVVIRIQILSMSVSDARSLGTTYGAGTRGIDFSGGSSGADGKNTWNLNFSTLAAGAPQFNVALNALQSAGRVKTIASPTIMAMDGRQSIIELGEDIISRTTSEPVTVGGGPSPQINYVSKPELGKIQTRLTLMPRISLDGVSLSIHPYISDRAKEYRSNPQRPDEITATTTQYQQYDAQEIFVRDGQTIVIGGLIKDEKVQNVTKIPVISDALTGIPLVGGLLAPLVTQTHETVAQREVQIYLTPEVVKDEVADARY